jgi:ankyrin repeat protein
MNGNENLARFLLDHGADRGIKDEVGRTPLEMALESGQEGVARIIHERTD